MRLVYLEVGSRISLDDTPIATGKEGGIFEILSPSEYQGCCVKIFFKSHLTAQTEKKIRYMVGHQLPNLLGKASQSFRFAWPIKCVFNKDGLFIGYIMQKAFEGSVTLKYFQASEMNKKLDNTIWLSRFDYNGNVESDILGYRLKLIRNVSFAIRYLHSFGSYVLGDIKPDNIMVSPNGKITMLDMNAIQIKDGDLFFPNTTHTPEYLPPEYFNMGIGKSPTKPLDLSWDCFGAAVVFYRMLFAIHPYAKVKAIPSLGDLCTIDDYVKNNLFPYGPNYYNLVSVGQAHNKFNLVNYRIRELFKKAFGYDYEYYNRPSLDDWYQILSGKNN